MLLVEKTCKWKDKQGRLCKISGLLWEDNNEINISIQQGDEEIYFIDVPVKSLDRLWKILSGLHRLYLFRA